MRRPPGSEEPKPTLSSVRISCNRGRQASALNLRTSARDITANTTSVTISTKAPVPSVEIDRGQLATTLNGGGPHLRYQNSATGVSTRWAPGIEGGAFGGEVSSNRCHKDMVIRGEMIGTGGGCFASGLLSG